MAAAGALGKKRTPSAIDMLMFELHRQSQLQGNVTLSQEVLSRESTVPGSNDFITAQDVLQAVETHEEQVQVLEAAATNLSALSTGMSSLSAAGRWLSLTGKKDVSKRKDALCHVVRFVDKWSRLGYAVLFRDDQRRAKQKAQQVKQLKLLAEQKAELKASLSQHLCDSVVSMVSEYDEWELMIVHQRYTDDQDSPVHTSLVCSPYWLARSLELPLQRSEADGLGRHRLDDRAALALIRLLRTG